MRENGCLQGMLLRGSDGRVGRQLIKMKLKGDIPQIKICGITLPEQAEQCVALGADAIGCVFFTKSPRDVSDAQAKEIGSALGGKTSCVGVFVDADRDTILKKVERCGLTGVQLHGNESPELIAALHGLSRTAAAGLKG